MLAGSRVGWYGHSMRKEETRVCRKEMSMNVNGWNSKGWSKKRWLASVKEDMRKKCQC